MEIKETKEVDQSGYKKTKGGEFTEQRETSPMDRKSHNTAGVMRKDNSDMCNGKLADRTGKGGGTDNEVSEEFGLVVASEIAQHMLACGEEAEQGRQEAGMTGSEKTDKKSKTGAMKVLETDSVSYEDVAGTSGQAIAGNGLENDIGCSLLSYDDDAGKSSQACAAAPRETTFKVKLTRRKQDEEAEKSDVASAGAEKKTAIDQKLLDECLHSISFMCDKCKRSIPSGNRFHCVTCPDFDLCPECFETNIDHNHEFVPLDETCQIPMPKNAECKVS